MTRVITEARRYSEQAVVVVSPYTDDRLRSLAAHHSVSYGKAARVALRVGLLRALNMTREEFMTEHAQEDEIARRGHEHCIGPWCDGKAGHARYAK